MRIVILTGGTGSTALQRGLYDTFEESRDRLVTKILVNAYDNGLSTGAVRRVMNGQILGPSDVRKNQGTRLQFEDPVSPWLNFLHTRFSVEVDEAQSFCVRQIDRLIGEHRLLERPYHCCAILPEAIDAYFRSPLARRVPYRDFSLANVVYAGLARKW